MSGPQTTQRYQLPSTVALVSSANVFTQPQTFKGSVASGPSATFEDSSGNTIFTVTPGGAGHQSVSLNMYAANGQGAGGLAWNINTDQSASIPYRDFVISREEQDGTDSDPNGLYGSYVGTDGGGVKRPSSWAFGLSQPADVGNKFRLKVMASGTAGGDVTQGGLEIPWSVGQTGDMLAIGSSNDAETAFRVLSDGTINAHASVAANTTVADGGTNSTTTVTTAGAATTMLGQYLTGAGIPGGTYVTGVSPGVSITISQAATATASNVTLTFYSTSYRVRTNGHVPLISLVNNGSGGTNWVSSASAFSLGPGAIPNESSTFAIRQTGTNSITFSLKTASWGNLQIAANGTTPGDATIGTANATALRLYANSAATVTTFAIDTTQNVIVGPGARATAAELAVGATSALFYVPTMNGTPTGTPSALPTGAAPMVIDRTGNKLWFYIGGAWKGVTVA